MDLTLERMEFLHADPKYDYLISFPVIAKLLFFVSSDFELLEIVGTGSVGVVRKMRYKGKIYAIKTIHPYFNRYDMNKGRRRAGSLGVLFRGGEGEKEEDKLRESKGKEKETPASPSKDNSKSHHSFILRTIYSIQIILLDAQKGDTKSFVNGLEYMKKIEQLGTTAMSLKQEREKY